GRGRSARSRERGAGSKKPEKAGVERQFVHSRRMGSARSGRKDRDSSRAPPRTGFPGGEALCSFALCSPLPAPRSPLTSHPLPELEVLLLDLVMRGHGEEPAALPVGEHEPVAYLLEGDLVQRAEQGEPLGLLVGLGLHLVNGVAQLGGVQERKGG